MALLEVKNLHVEVDGKKILNGLELSVGRGSVHALMGPNGSGKSTLAHVLAGKEEYVVTQGEVLLDGEDILALPPDERAARGLFLAFQYPFEIPGVATMTFLRAAQEARRGRDLHARVPQARARGRWQARHRTGDAAARRQCRVLRRREEAQRDPADGAVATAAVRARRDGFRPRYRRAQNRRGRRQCPALARARIRGDHALPAPA